MKKPTITIILITAVLLIVTTVLFVTKSGSLEKNKATIESAGLIIPFEENKEIVNDNRALTVDSVLEDVEPIVKWEGPEYSRGTILWNTKDEELKLEGRGYLFGERVGSNEMKLQDKHDKLKVYLRDLGFEHDKYNVGSSDPESERSILKLSSIGCELYIRDDKRKDSTDMGLLCTDLPEKATSEVPEPMSEKGARSIAETSECIKDGALKDNAFYNENSKTWWIDLDIDKPGCNPACVVYEDETVEINWRCTGLIPD